MVYIFVDGLVLAKQHVLYDDLDGWEEVKKRGREGVDRIPRVREELLFFPRCGIDELLRQRKAEDTRPDRSGDGVEEGIDVCVAEAGYQRTEGAQWSSVVVTRWCDAIDAVAGNEVNSGEVD